MRLGNSPRRLVLVPKSLGVRQGRSLVATHIAVFSPRRSYGRRRISTRLGWQTGNGMRRSVFSFGVTEPALLLDGSYDFPCDLVGSPFKEPLGRSGFAIDR